MSIKNKRGMKLKCRNEKCGKHFYDLNSDPIHCPICQTAYSENTSISAAQIDPIKFNSHNNKKDEDIKAGAKTDEDYVLKLNDDDDTRKTLKTTNEANEKD